MELPPLTAADVAELRSAIYTDRTSSTRKPQDRYGNPPGRLYAERPASSVWNENQTRDIPDRTRSWLSFVLKRSMKMGSNKASITIANRHSYRDSRMYNRVERIRDDDVDIPKIGGRIFAVVWGAETGWFIGTITGVGRSRGGDLEVFYEQPRDVDKDGLPYHLKVGTVITIAPPLDREAARLDESAVVESVIAAGRPDAKVPQLPYEAWRKILGYM